MTQNNFSISISLENIGPHYGDKKLSFSETVNSNKSIFYATNGTGKSFISRAFRLSAPSMGNIVADNILTIGKQAGSFSFKIHSNYEEKKLEIQIKRGEAPLIKKFFRTPCFMFSIVIMWKRILNRRITL